MQRFVVAFVGPSGSGKTSLIERLVTHYTRRGHSVGVIKHTHHELNRERRGDTARFLDSGARVAILAGDREAVIFSRDAIASSKAYETPTDLLEFVQTQVIFIEGFKGSMSSETLAFGDGEIAGLVEFLDTIPRR